MDVSSHRISRGILFGLLIANLVALISSSFYDNQSAKAISAIIIGDIIVGGLFPVHEKGQGNTPCGEINLDRGIQRLETMLFTIDQINNNENMLPGIKLGASIYDTCARETYALEQSLEFVRASISTLDASEFECEDGSKAKIKSVPTAVAGVIGGSYSSVSIQVANLLRLFRIPQISYASTSAALSDTSRFDYFVRTVPPDTFQARALVDIIQFFNWTYVATVSSEGNYGESGISYLHQEARAKNICIATTEKIPAKSNAHTFDTIIHNLKIKANARVVVLFVRVEDAKMLLNAATKANTTDRFVWIAADGWGREEAPVESNQISASGALTIELQSNNIGAFDDYFQNLNPKDNIRNPWFKEYWEKVHNCYLSKKSASLFRKPCSGNERITPHIYKQESKVQFIYDAVYAMADSLHRMQLDLCPNTTKLCAAMAKINGELLLNKYILNTSFIDGYGAHVQFDEQGDALGRYSIMNYQRNRQTRKYEYKVIGSWTGALRIESDQIVWAGGTLDVPTSQCSYPCAHGEIKNMQTGDTCCWICTKCQSDEYLKDEFTCKACENGFWPHEDKDGCYELTYKHMEWASIFAIVPMCLSCVGIIITSIVIFTMMHYNDTPVVRAAGRELSYMLLCGCLCCYVMSFILLAKPSTAICAIQRFGVGLGFAVIYSSLLTKTNRISRIFYSARKSAKRPPFISPKSQIVITSILICIQILITTVWMVLAPPGTRPYYPFGKRDVVILKCKVDDISFLVSLIYNMLLITVCTIYAIKTRRIPENFNESKFIGFAMYTTCIIWLAFIPIYFGTLDSYEIQTTTLCVSISLSASVALLCLFTPKMYIIVFQPEKNVRKLTMNSATYKKAPTSSMCSTANHGTPSEHIRLNVQHSPMKLGACTTTETETDRDSMASL